MTNSFRSGDRPSRMSSPPALAPAPRKATVKAPSNIAFVKYWGARDLAKAIPENPSISMIAVDLLQPLHGGARCRPATATRSCGGVRQGFEAGAAVVRRPGRRPPRPVARLGGRLRRLPGGHRKQLPVGRRARLVGLGFRRAHPGGARRARPRGEPGRRKRARPGSSGSGSAARSVLGGYVMWPVPSRRR